MSAVAGEVCVKRARESTGGGDDEDRGRVPARDGLEIRGADALIPL